VNVCRISGLFCACKWYTGRSYHSMAGSPPRESSLSILVIICAEGLCSLVRDVEIRGVLTGTKVCRQAPSVSHLLFPNDCFLFFKANEDQAHVMKNILSTYELAYGQAINLPKPEIYCSRNVPDDLKANITDILGVQVVLGTGKYLAEIAMLLLLTSRIVLGRKSFHGVVSVSLKQVVR